VPWAAWSGGEGQRLRLAASAGLSSLILNRRNVNPEFEFYDEPSKHLSEEGLMDLANYLSNRAQTLGKQIWLVDHNIPNFSGISGSIKIVKDDKGSRIV
jgi:DNA repair exonuclease SbcCD ATPase subunit